MPNYIIGDKPPNTYPDAGAGAYCTAFPTPRLASLKSAILTALNLPHAEVHYSNTVKHMRHYMGNGGGDLRVDVRELMGKSLELKLSFEDELFNAKAFCETLSPGVHMITSAECAVGRFETGDLKFSIGDYKYWGQGKAAVTAVDNRSSRRTGMLEFEYHFYDRYNWDFEDGKETPMPIVGVPVTDKFMAEFHQKCLAKEYDMRGTISHKVTWEYLWR